MFDDELLSAAENIFKEKGIGHVGNSYHAFTGREFSGHLANAIVTKSDVLLTLNSSPQSSDMLRQAVSFGMKEDTTILVTWASGSEQFESLGTNLYDGARFGAQCQHGVDMPANRGLARRTQAAFETNPNYNLADLYTCTKILLDAVAKAGSADLKAAIAALQSMKYNGLTDPEEICTADRQVLKNYYLLKSRPKSRMKNRDDFTEVIAVGRAFLPVEQTHCKLA